MPDIPPIPRAYASYILELLKVRRTRDRERVFVLEGVKPILEVLQASPQHIVTLVVSPEFLRRQPPELKHRLAQGPYRLFGSTDARFAQLSDVDSPAGILAIVRQPEWDEQRQLGQANLLGVFCDRLQDPTNLGTIIRTAAGLGVGALWLSPQSVDVFNPKVVRATSGALFQLPIFPRTQIEHLASSGLTLLAADVAEGGRSLRSLNSRPSRTLLVIGNEGEGLSPAVLAHVTMRMTIPLKQGVESLNVAAATAIFLFHLTGLPVSDRAATREAGST